MVFIRSGRDWMLFFIFLRSIFINLHKFSSIFISGFCGSHWLTLIWRSLNHSGVSFMERCLAQILCQNLDNTNRYIALDHPEVLDRIKMMKSYHLQPIRWPNFCLLRISKSWLVQSWNATYLEQDKGNPFSQNVNFLFTANLHWCFMENNMAQTIWNCPNEPNIG